ncbi:hypothetical protein ACTI_78840 [Actinoplanes sp. OR16]|nr:hypothetical protein ACTI_78840 [Actinoplanes sp. OR16]
MAEFARTKARDDGYHTYGLVCHNARGKETKERLHGGSRAYHLRRRYGIDGASAPSVARTTRNT